MRDAVRLAIDLADQDRHGEATEILRQAVRANSDDLTAWRWLAHVTRDPDEALLAVRTILSRRPDDPWAREAWPAYEARVRSTREIRRRKRQGQALRFLALAFSAVVIALCGAIAYLGRESRGAAMLLENVSLSPTPAFRLEESSSVDYYSFPGASIAEIQAGLASQGPQVPGGTHTIAMTNYQIYVTWEMAQSISVCRMGNVVVHLEVLYTYPQWLRADSPDPQAAAEWDRFEPYVRQHEEHHGEIAHECAQDLVEKLQVFEPGGSCMGAQENLDTLVSDLYKQCEGHQRAFDEQEGRTTFPLP